MPISLSVLHPSFKQLLQPFSQGVFGEEFFVRVLAVLPDQKKVKEQLVTIRDSKSPHWTVSVSSIVHQEIDVSSFGQSIKKISSFDYAPFIQYLFEHSNIPQHAMDGIIRRLSAAVVPAPTFDDKEEEKEKDADAAPAALPLPPAAAEVVAAPALDSSILQGHERAWAWVAREMWEKFIKCELKLPVKKEETDEAVEGLHKRSRLPFEFKAHLYALRARFQTLSHEAGLVLDPLSKENTPPHSSLADNWFNTPIGRDCVAQYKEQARGLAANLFASFIQQRQPNRREQPRYDGVMELYPVIIRRASLLENRLAREWRIMRDALQRTVGGGELQLFNGLNVDSDSDLDAHDESALTKGGVPFHPISKLFLREALRIIRDFVECLFNTGSVDRLYKQPRPDFVKWVSGKYIGQRLITAWVDDFYRNLFIKMVEDYQKEFARYGENAWYARLTSDAPFVHVLDRGTYNYDGIVKLLKLFDLRLKDAWKAYKLAYAEKGIKADKPSIPLLAKLVDELSRYLKTAESNFRAGRPFSGDGIPESIKQWVMDYDQQLRRKPVPSPSQSAESDSEKKRRLFAPYRKQINRLFGETLTPQIPVTFHIDDPDLNRMGEEYAKRLSEQAAALAQILKVKDHIRGFSLNTVQGIDGVVITKITGKHDRDEMDGSDDEQKEIESKDTLSSEESETKEDGAGLESSPDFKSRKRLAMGQPERASSTDVTRSRDARGESSVKSQRTTQPRTYAQVLGRANAPAGAGLWRKPSPSGASRGDVRDSRDGFGKRR